ncbi:MAG: hypothetical protein GPJ51_01830 [Candidatus Heimdallarchaeota archaeon]|nr:hypothetical protein [Candidatus Heimdallarchaeota archaeon]
MIDTEFLFVFDTSLLQSLINTKMLNLTDKISEIEKYYNNITFIVPKTILKELAYSREKIVYLHKNFNFQEVSLSLSQLNKYQEINSTLSPHCFSKDEVGDYEIIHSAIENNTSKLVTIVVSNDEGIHEFLTKGIPEKEVKAIWGENFLLFCSRHSFDIKTRKEFEKAAELQKEYLEDYRKKQMRGVIEFRDFEKVLVKTSSSLDYSSEIREAFDHLIRGEQYEEDIPQHLREIGKMITDTMSIIDLHDEELLEDKIHLLEEQIQELSLTDRDAIKHLLAPHLLTAYVELAKIYDHRNFLSAEISTFERMKANYATYMEEDSLSNMTILLSWLHLLSGSNSLSRLYFKRIPKKYDTSLVRKLNALLSLLNTSDIDLNIQIFNRLTNEEWVNIQELMKICYNQVLCDKISLLLEAFGEGTKFELDARHYAIRNEMIENYSILHFLRNDFLIVSKDKKSDSINLHCSNSKMGEFDFRFPIVEKLEEATKGDVIFIQDGKIARVSKPRPGIKTKGTIYFSSINADDIELKQFGKII